MSGRGGHLLLLWKSPSVEHIPVCSAVSLIPVGDTQVVKVEMYGVFPNWSDRIRLRRLGLTVHCHRSSHRDMQQASLPCGCQDRDTYDAVAQCQHL